MINRWKILLYGGAFFLLGNSLFAQDSAAYNWGLTLNAVISTVIYSILGLIVLLIGYKVFDWMTPYDFQKEIAEDDNTAVGVMIAGVFIALAIIIAAAIV